MCIFNFWLCTNAKILKCRHITLLSFNGMYEIYDKNPPIFMVSKRKRGKTSEPYQQKSLNDTFNFMICDQNYFFTHYRAQLTPFFISRCFPSSLSWQFCIDQNGIPWLACSHWLLSLASPSPFCESSPTRRPKGGKRKLRSIEQQKEPLPITFFIVFL